MSVLNENMGNKEFRILPCAKCGKIPSVVRCSDPAEIEKRYMVRCTSDSCKITKPVYGSTETFAIVEWNRFTSKVIHPKTDSEWLVRS